MTNSRGSAARDPGTIHGTMCERTRTDDGALPSGAGGPFTVRRGAVVRWAVGAILFGAVYGAVLLVLQRLNLQDRIADLAERAGAPGVALFLVLMAAAVMSPLPDSPVAIAGLVAYGPLAGMMLVVSGSWAGAALNFLLVRALGRERFHRRFPRMAAPLDDLAERLGIELVVVLRFLPTVSFDIVSYAAAITRMPFHRFAGATLLGQLPGPAIAALIGAGAGGAGGRVTAALTALVMVLIVALLLLRRTVHRGRRAGDAKAHGARDR